MTTINRIGYQSDYGLAEGGINPPGSPEARAIIAGVRTQLRGEKKKKTYTTRGWLNKQMSDRKITSPVLGAAIGVSDSLVRRWRCGQSVPSADEIAALAAYFETDVPTGGLA